MTATRGPEENRPAFRGSHARPDEIWLVLTGRFSARLFVDTGIVDGLREELGDRLVPVLLCADDQVDHWLPRLGDRILRRSDFAARSGRPERALASVDEWLERQIGTYPLAVRFNRRNELLLERMEPGHPMPYLNESLIGGLPEWRVVERAARRWTYARWRHIPRGVARRFEERCGALVLGTVSGQRVIPFMTAARRLRRPVVGYVASWDHTVGKGVISPHLDRYLVQNRIMQDDLAHYHEIPPERVTVTGWPLTDVFARRTSRREYEGLLQAYGLDPGRPVVLYAGNSAANMPTDGAIVERLLEWRGGDRFGIIVRPHPNDAAFRERFEATQRHDGVHLQAPSYADLDVLTTLLQHVDCVVANAGTILLDAIVNDRPAICVLYDEGASPGERARAELNVTGHHYRDLLQSGAFLCAGSFAELAAAVERSLAAPDELAAERAHASMRIVGVVDGHAAERVVDAIVAGVAAGDRGFGAGLAVGRRVAGLRSPST